MLFLNQTRNELVVHVDVGGGCLHQSIICQALNGIKVVSRRGRRTNRSADVSLSMVATEVWSRPSRAGIVGRMELFPAMPLADWQDTKATLHRFAQVVGKIRLAASPRRNHWWNVPFHLTGRGVTTRPMGRAEGPIFTIDFDFVDHQLLVTSGDGHAASFPLYEQSVASFYRNTLDALAAVGVEMSLERPWPYDLPDSGRPFAVDTMHASYDTTWATRYWQVLSQVNLILEEFAATFSGKVSPVHHFWHTFDIAHTRFSDRRTDLPPQADSVTCEAYSREVISFGFWFGDDTLPEPAFYSYTAPEPEGLAGETLQPSTAEWMARKDSHLAILRYDDARAEADPHAAVRAFYESAYQAGALRAGWDVAALACPGGVTDPHHPPLQS